jgi:hypothetical protein
MKMHKIQLNVSKVAMIPCGHETNYCRYLQKKEKAIQGILKRVCFCLSC